MLTSMRRGRLLLLLSAPLLASCNPDILDSGNVTVRLTLGGSDIQSGLIGKDASIGSATLTNGPVPTGASSPVRSWDEFIAYAQGQCGGDPAGFSIRFVSMGIVSGSGTVARLDDVLTGTAWVYFSDGASSTLDVAATYTALGTSATLAPQVTQGGLAPWRPMLLAGNFRIGLRGSTSNAATDSFSMVVDVVLAMNAHCT